MSRDVNKTEVNLIFFLIYKKSTESNVFGIKNEWKKQQPYERILIAITPSQKWLQ